MAFVMSSLSNYPLGAEPELAGLDIVQEEICASCTLTDGDGNCDPNRPDCPLTIRDTLLREEVETWPELTP